MTATITIWTRVAKVAAQIFTVTFAGHFDEPHFAYLQNLAPRFIGTQMILEHLINHLPVLLSFHIDEIDNDNSADIA